MMISHGEDEVVKKTKSKEERCLYSPLLLTSFDLVFFVKYVSNLLIFVMKTMFAV